MGSSVEAEEAVKVDELGGAAVPSQRGVIRH